MKILAIIFLCCYSSFVIGQDNTAEKEVKQVILDVFDAMRESDSIKLKTCFYEDVTVKTAFSHPQKGNLLESGNIQDFIRSVGTPHKGVYDERLGNYEVHIDGPLASFAVDYFFFIDETFSHCGVDYFQLFNDGDTWKIFFLSDTRRKLPCDLPDKTW